MVDQVANEPKESICYPSMPKGPTMKRHTTAKDKLEGVVRAMQLHARVVI
jgi:hypothetical protein